MKKQDVLLIIMLAASSLLILGIMGENIHSAVLIKAPVAKIDVAKEKARIKNADLIPYEAKYWKVLDQSQ